jgi:hypothetical protein
MVQIFGDIFGKELERYKAMQPGVFGLINDTHSSAAQHLNDSIMGNSLTYHVPSGVGLLL